MKYVDYGTMQSEAQRRVLEMQRRARKAVYSQAPEWHDSPPEAASVTESGGNGGRDPDEAMILALASLLLRENADILLILALLYVIL